MNNKRITFILSVGGIGQSRVGHTIRRFLEALRTFVGDHQDIQLSIGAIEDDEPATDDCSQILDKLDELINNRRDINDG